LQNGTRHRKRITVTLGDKMVFVRKKTTIKDGHTYTYYYLVENKRVDGKVVQKDIEYLGGKVPEKYLKHLSKKKPK